MKGLFRPHYVTWSEQQRIEFHGPEYLQNVVQIITETGLRVYKELDSDEEGSSGPSERGRLDSGLEDSKRHRRSPAYSAGHRSLSSPDGHRRGESVLVSERSESERAPDHVQDGLAQDTSKRAKVPYFRIYDLRSTYATRLSAGGVADEWVTQMLRQGDAQVFKKYSQMKLQMKREALEKLNRRASEMAAGEW